MTLPPAELLQAGPVREPSDFWLGFIVGAGCLLFWAAVGFGTGIIKIGGA